MPSTSVRDSALSLAQANKMTSVIHPVLLCGGSGTRLWPLSRKSYPKQFTQLNGEKSLFQESALRFAVPGFASPIVVTGSDFRFIVLEQLAACEIIPETVLIEPEGRNTAPAILAAALHLHSQDPDAVMIVVPADHIIPDAQTFRAAVSAALPSAKQGSLVTFGIRPDRPETGYGWLELSRAVTKYAEPVAQQLVRFVEKPDTATAKTLYGSGRHLWNSGIFLFTTASLITAFEKYQARILAETRRAIDEAQSDLGFTRLASGPWSAIESISIDYAVMEKSDNLMVVPFNGAWSDLGGWEAVWREGTPDNDGNVTHGHAYGIGCSNSLLRSESEGQQLVGIGLDNIVAIAMPDAVLVAHKSKAQEVKEAVALLKDNGAYQAETLPRDFRPWGWFENLVTGPRFQVKRIVVHSGAALSLQSHHHRSEHWVVVAGTARVTIGEEVQLLTENQSVYIPLGSVHRLENPGKVLLTLIEVQTGSYLGEDDIVRYEDFYARE
jgi:mannose-1-phosphate guanylyltransferase/mannose-6-phosphate isomerase